MGGVGGAIFHFFKGFYNAPSRERLRGGLTAVKLRAPILGGSFAMWGGLFSTFDCLFLYYRQIESPSNAIMAGALTGYILAARSGFQIAWRNGIAGAIILAIIEGVNVAYTSLMIRQQIQMQNEMAKLSEERQRRMMQGLPDFTEKELNDIMESKQNQRSGFFNRG